MTCPYEAALLARWKMDAAHDLGHIRRVWASACAIVDGDALGVDREALRAAVVFHDLVNVPKDHPERASASRKSADAACMMLQEMGMEGERLDVVRHAIEAHSFSANIPPETDEARVLRDADRLDALGAVGIARMMTVTGQLGRALYDPDDPIAAERDLDDQRWGLDHFETKLFRLGEGMLTATGQQMAEDRIAYMRLYLQRFLSEILAL